MIVNQKYKSKFTMNKKFLLVVAKQLIDSTEPFPIDFDDAWQWLGFESRTVAEENFLQPSYGHEFTKKHDYTKKNKVIKLSYSCFRTWISQLTGGEIYHVKSIFIECEFEGKGYFVYFIYVAKNVKIGFCNATLKNLKQRLAECKCWCPDSFFLGLLYVVNKDTERALHSYFNGIRIENSEVFICVDWIEHYIGEYSGWLWQENNLSFNPNGITWQEWAKFWETRDLAKLDVEKMKKFGEIKEDYSYDEYGYCDDYECYRYNEITEEMEDITSELVEEFDEDIVSMIWKENYSKKFTRPENEFKSGHIGKNVEDILKSFTKNDNEIYDEDDGTINDDFTGLADDGFYYVDGHLCIEDVFGIYH